MRVCNGASLVPVQMWHGVSPAPMRMWAGPSPSRWQMWLVACVNCGIGTRPKVAHPRALIMRLAERCSSGAHTPHTVTTARPRVLPRPATCRVRPSTQGRAHTHGARPVDPATTGWGEVGGGEPKRPRADVAGASAQAQMCQPVDPAPTGRGRAMCRLLRSRLADGSPRPF